MRKPLMAIAALALVVAGFVYVDQKENYRIKGLLNEFYAENPVEDIPSEVPISDFRLGTLRIRKGLPVEFINEPGHDAAYKVMTGKTGNSDISQCYNLTARKAYYCYLLAIRSSPNGTEFDYTWLVETSRVETLSDAAALASSYTFIPVESQSHLKKGLVCNKVKGDYPIETLCDVSHKALVDWICLNTPDEEILKRFDRPPRDYEEASCMESALAFWGG